MALVLDWKGKGHWGDGHACMSEYEGYGNWCGQWPLAQVASSLYMSTQLIVSPAL